MNVKQWFIFPVFVFLSLFAIGVCLAMALRGMEIGDPAPDFRFRTIDDKEITLKNQEGKILILGFWRREQDFSKKVLIDLERIYQKYGDQGVTVLAVNADQAPVSEIRRIRVEQNLSYLLAGDAKFKTYGQFGLMVLPTTLVLGPNGRLAHYSPIHGKGFYDQIRGHARLLLGEITPVELEKELNPGQIKVLPDAKRKAGLHLTMAKMLMNEESLKHKAREELEKAVQTDPSLLEARILLARLYLADQEFEKAKSELKEALKLDSDSEEAQQLLKIANRGDE